MQKEVLNSLKLIFLVLLIASCSGIRQVVLQKELTKRTEKSDILSNYFVGLTLYDPDTEVYLININGDKYFTPASNTKILTLAAWLSTENDSIPSFRYQLNGNNAYLEPLGDPTFLHPDFPFQQSLMQLSKLSLDTVFIVWPTRTMEPFGSGWAWDDYNYAYQPERSIFPMYGNTVHAFIRGEERTVTPSFFQNYIEFGTNKTGRSKDFNFFQISESASRSGSKEIQIPFKTGEELTLKLLQDTLGVPVLSSKEEFTGGEWETSYGYNRLPVLATMMLNSDNFLAEQLLVNAQMWKGVNSLETFMKQTEQTLFKNSPHPLEWVDGSGLSRYNMFTPISLVKVLEVIYKQLSWQEINLIFPKGGVSGTIKNWYAAETPYVFAKTGTLRHNHCLSGYIQTKSGRRLIFSFMNNHYTNGTTEVKQEMQQILEAIRDAY